MLPTPDEIRQSESRERPLPIEPWVAAGLSRLWQTMKKNIAESLVITSSPAIASGTQEPPRNVQSMPASAHNHS